MRGLIDRKGEQFAYLQGDTLFTLDGEATGRLRNGFIEDMAGNLIWRVVGDGVYTLNSSETIGYFGDEHDDQYDL
jgi:hypothetical protein